MCCDKKFLLVQTMLSIGFALRSIGCFDVHLLTLVAEWFDCHFVKGSRHTSELKRFKKTAALTDSELMKPAC